MDGVRVRKSMDTRDWARATRNLGKIEDPSYGLRPCVQPGCNEMVQSGRCARHTREIPRAIAAYHDTRQDVAESTKRSRRRTLRTLEEFTSAPARGLKTVDQIELEHPERTTGRAAYQRPHLDERTRDAAALLPVVRSKRLDSGKLC